MEDGRKRRVQAGEHCSAGCRGGVIAPLTRSAPKAMRIRSQVIVKGVSLVKSDGIVPPTLVV